MTRERLVSIFFVLLLIFVVYQIFLIFFVFYRAIFWGGLLAFAFYPLYLRLRQTLKTHDVAAAAIMTFLIFLIFGPPIVWILVNLTGQAIEFSQAAFRYVNEGGLENLIAQIRSLGFVRSLEAHAVEWEPLKQSIAEWILNTAKAIGNFSATQVGRVTKNFLFVILNVFLTFVLLFVFLWDGEKIYKFIYKIAPLEERNKKYIFGQINETFAAVIRGQLLTSLTQALLTGFIFWILRLPGPVFFGAATFIVTMIPVVGASFVWVPFVAYLVVLGQYTKATLLFFLGVLVISLADNLLKPALIGEKTKLPYFLLFFGVMGGLQVYGLMGVFIAPVVLSLFFALIRIYQQKYLQNLS